MKLSTLANILLTEKDISVSEINLLIEYVKGIYRNLGDEIIEEYYYVRSNGKRSGFDKLTGVEFYRDRSIHETVELEDIDVDDYESILYSLVEDMKICSSLFFVMDDSKDKDVSLQKIKVFFEDDTSIPDNYKDRIRTNKYRYIIDDITKMVSVKKSYTELNIDMNYLNLVKELVFEEFKKEYFLIKQNTDKSSEMFARDVVIVFNLDSESLLDEMKSYLSRFIDLISDCDVEVGKDPIRLFQIGAYEYELILDDLTFLNQVVGWENKTTKKFKEFINKMKNESDENHVFEKIIENYSMRGLIFKLSKDIEKNGVQISALNNLKSVLDQF